MTYTYTYTYLHNSDAQTQGAGENVRIFGHLCRTLAVEDSVGLIKRISSFSFAKLISSFFFLTPRTMKH